MFLSPLMPFLNLRKKKIRVVQDFRELNGYFLTEGRTLIDVRRAVEADPDELKILLLWEVWKQAMCDCDVFLTTLRESDDRDKLLFDVSR